MAEQKIEFRKVRDFGENIGDIFQFLRQEAKPFLRAFFAICGIFMLLTSVMSGLLQAQMFTGVFDTATFNRVSPFSRIFTANYFLTVLVAIVTYSSMHVTVFSYIKGYIDNGNNSPDIEQVWKLFTKNFSKVFLLTIPIHLLTIIGFLFCLVPGFYFGVVLAPFAMILIYEGLTFGEAFARCTYLIKENFWSSFGIYIVAMIIYYAAQTLIGGIVAGSAGLLTYFTTKDFKSVIGIATSFINIFGYFFYVIPLLGIALNYFTLVENKDGLGILNRIDTIGKTKINPDRGEEEF
ncbi:MAG: hypothetical protein ABI151_01225 [Chitinophagaceae bacterium]